MSAVISDDLRTALVAKALGQMEGERVRLTDEEGDELVGYVERSTERMVVIRDTDGPRRAAPTTVRISDIWSVDAA